MHSSVLFLAHLWPRSFATLKSFQKIAVAKVTARLSCSGSDFGVGILSIMLLAGSNCPLRANATQKRHETPERLQEANLFVARKNKQDK